ncbi:hypothetical protein HNY73_003951 [Argiope bruennichi]|uniref:Uncharacterized protein n=1 Tax=Argiope bruennichi TaxID=94029 RepID=A0A8T0FMC9_ARGBR|nr:hypothetical protein HNY73_003951 [Argiope bruennichi]
MYLTQLRNISQAYNVSISMLIISFNYSFQKLSLKKLHCWPQNFHHPKPSHYPLRYPHSSHHTDITRSEPRIRPHHTAPLPPPSPAFALPTQHTRSEPRIRSHPQHYPLPSPAFVSPHSHYPLRAPHSSHHTAITRSEPRIRLTTQPLPAPSPPIRLTTQTLPAPSPAFVSPHRHYPLRAPHSSHHTDITRSEPRIRFTTQTLPTQIPPHVMSFITHHRNYSIRFPHTLYTTPQTLPIPLPASITQRHRTKHYPIRSLQALYHSTDIIHPLPANIQQHRHHTSAPCKHTTAQTSYIRSLQTYNSTDIRHPLPANIQQHRHQTSAPCKHYIITPQTSPILLPALMPHHRHYPFWPPHITALHETTL